MFRKGSTSQRVALAAIGLLIMTYTVYHLSGLFRDTISTFAVGVTSEVTSINYSGYVFRDETVLTSPNGGAVEYHVEDGTKVSRGQQMATVYEKGDASVREQIRLLDAQIALLEKGTTGLVGVDMGELKQGVSDDYYALCKLLASSESSGLSYHADSLLVGLNRMETLSGKTSTASETLEVLRAERNRLLGEAGDFISYGAEKSGYFYSTVDGYEDRFTMEAAKNLTAESFYRLIYSSPSNGAEHGETAYGKMSYSAEWILVLPVKASEAKYFELGEVYEGIFTDNNNSVIPLTLENQVEGEGGSVLLVFRADRLPSGFTFSRAQSVRIEIDEVSGLYVPKNVVTREKGKRGVYILRGSVVYFRRIEIVFEGSDYYLVKPGVEGDEEWTYLQANDLIILGGRNLFDGMVMD